jgi:hypothetical protein
MPTPEGFIPALAQPLRCAERGVATPFTAPPLLGARLRRRAARGGGFEVVVPSPAGREGWFILPWAEALEALQPSLMDRALIAALDAAELTPAQLREAALTAAEGGLGGRPLRRAAQAARTRQARREALTLAALNRHGAGFALEAFRGCGLPGQTAPHMVSLRRIRDFAQSLRAWLPEAVNEADHARATTLAQRAEQIAAAADVLIAANRARLGALRGLAPRWPELGPVWQAEAARAELVMDGWELLAGIWAMASEAERGPTLRRCLALAPPTAEEMRAWPGCGALTSMPECPAAPPEARFITAHRAEAVIADWLAPP